MHQFVQVACKLWCKAFRPGGLAIGGLRTFIFMSQISILPYCWTSTSASPLSQLVLGAELLSLAQSQVLAELVVHHEVACCGGACSQRTPAGPPLSSGPPDRVEAATDGWSEAIQT